MISDLHTFHIPVMGTGHSLDTPIRVAPFGIDSVISLVDDILCEKVREHYSREYRLPFSPVLKTEKDGRAKRISAYLDTVHKIVQIKMEAIKKLPFQGKNDKSRYFDMLPETSSLKTSYKKWLSLQPGPEKASLEKELTDRMQPGSIDVNIMVKLDRMTHDSYGVPLSDEYADAKSALRGFANSCLHSSIVFSAGLNQSLFNYVSQFGDFYRNEIGKIKKKIILKVGDFRSAILQGKILAKKGLEVYEYRIESALNCGGHAFPSDGRLLPTIMKEFREKRDRLVSEIRPMIVKYYEKKGWKYPKPEELAEPRVTVQGGIGTHGEVRRLTEEYGVDATGWATPFLLVPEATCVDKATRELLMKATEKDLYLSDVSPLGVPFNNVRNTGSDLWTQKRVENGTPGSPCLRGFLQFNTEFSSKPICVASRQYQKQKLDELAEKNLSEADRKRTEEEITVKACICHHLGNGALIALGIEPEDQAPQAICPGPNIAWFNRLYSLQEMVDHIYGRIPSLVPAERPHMYSKEISMYIDFFEKRSQRNDLSAGDVQNLEERVQNLEDSIEYCKQIAAQKPYETENLTSIYANLPEQEKRVRAVRERIAFLKSAVPQPS